MLCNLTMALRNEEIALSEIITKVTVLFSRTNKRLCKLTSGRKLEIDTFSIVAALVRVYPEI